MSYNTYDLQNILNTILQSHLQSAYPEVGNHSELKVNFNPSTFYMSTNKHVQVVTDGNFTSGSNVSSASSSLLVFQVSVKVNPTIHHKSIHRVQLYRKIYHKLYTSV